MGGIMNQVTRLQAAREAIRTVRRSAIFGVSLACLLAASGAHAAVVRAGSPVDFFFNLAEPVPVPLPVSFTNFTYQCGALCLPPNPETNRLAGQIQFEFGSARGLSDLGTRYSLTTPSPRVSFGSTLRLSPTTTTGTPVVATSSGLWVRVLRVGDDFGIDQLFLSGFSGSASVGLWGQQLAPVPLPAALPLFASVLGVGGLLGYGRRRQARRFRPASQ
jgi:hypothetical protein